ncbi:MAG TPA: glycosyltransferase [Thermoanaerobaculia bacterium]|jgi:glycosyltransferase involved in cell wall biosynthesis
MPRVSVLLPSYNAASYVDAAIESVQRQTFGDWELVAVDDASTDATASRLDAHASSRIHVHRNAQNLGMTGNWNRCLSLASGELVLKLDADDALKPTALERLVSAFEGDVAAAGIRTLSCDESLDPFDGIPGDDLMMRNGIDPYRDTTLPGDRWYGIAANGGQLWASSAFMVRRDLLTRLGGWDERFGCASDTEMMWRVMEQGTPIAHRGTVGNLYRIRPGSVSDVYRAQGWLTWEAVVGNLLSLSRVRTKRPLSRSLRMHYVRLWKQWHDAPSRPLPEAICGKLEDVMARIPPPPKLDVAMTRLRDGVSAA